MKPIAERIAEIVSEQMHAPMIAVRTQVQKLLERLDADGYTIVSKTEMGIIKGELETLKKAIAAPSPSLGQSVERGMEISYGILREQGKKMTANDVCCPRCGQVNPDPLIKNETREFPQANGMPETAAFSYVACAACHAILSLAAMPIRLIEQAGMMPAQPRQRKM